MLRMIPSGARVLLFSHSIFWLASNLLAPFLSIFYMSELSGVTLVEIGVSALIYYLTFGLFEPVAGILADRISGLKDELAFVFIGFIARGVLFILLAFAENSWHLYMFQFWLGFFRGLSGPSSKVLYAKFIQSKQSGMLWGLDESLANLSAALGAGVGGYLAIEIGFRNMLIVTGLLTIVSGIINYPLIKKLKK